jgi:outer membrane receptor protein involved in Fe transport
MKTLMFLLAVVYISFSASGQTDTSRNSVISGRLIDDSNKPVSLATVVLHRQSDSIALSTRLSDDLGNFSFATENGSYFIIVTMLSSEQKRVDGIVVQDADMVLPDIRLTTKAKVLNEVVVVAEKPAMRLELDKRVYSVGKDLSNTGGTASDVLNNVPSVTVDVEGNVSLRGSESVRILIDGKVSALTSTADALRQLPANMIESIEVITNPSSRYEATGEAGMINIVLKKNRARGVNGTFNLNGGFPAAYGASFNINYRKNKLNLFSTYGIDYRSTPGSGTSYQQFISSDTSFAYNQSRQIRRSGVSHNVILGFDYFINPMNTLTASVLYNPSDGINKSDIVYDDLNEIGSPVQTVTRNEREHERDKELESALSFRRKFKEKNHELTADIKFILEDEVELTDYEQANKTNGQMFLQRADNRAKENTLLVQADYVRPLTENAKVEAGFRSSIRSVKNNYLLEQRDSTLEWTALPAFDNNMIYSEDIHAAYLMGSAKWKKFSWQLGLRAELSDITTELLKTKQVNNRRYLNFFPSASAAYEIDEKNSLQLSYSYRVNRPRYRDLLPYSDFSDLRSFFVGNPDLNPEFTHSLEAGHLLNFESGSLLSNIYYRYKTGVIERINEVDSLRISFVFPVNLSTQNAYGLEFNWSQQLTDAWRINTNVNLFQAITEGNFEGQELYSNTFTGTGRLTTQVSIAKKWDVQTSINYRAPRITTQGKELGVAVVDIGAAGDILKGKATIAFNVRDLLNMRKRRTIIERDGYYSKNDFQWRARQFMITFSYRLNTMKEDSRRQNDGGGDEEL